MLRSRLKGPALTPTPASLFCLVGTSYQQKNLLLDNFIHSKSIFLNDTIEFVNFYYLESDSIKKNSNFKTLNAKKDLTEMTKFNLINILRSIFCFSFNQDLKTYDFKITGNDLYSEKINAEETKTNAFF